MTESGDEAKPATWVGRATARPAADPWRGVEPVSYPAGPYQTGPYPAGPYETASYPVTAVPAMLDPVTGRPVILTYAPPPRRRRGLTTFLIIAGVFAACCGGGATLALISNAAVRNAVGIGPAVPAVPSNPSARTNPTTPAAPTTPAPPPEPGLNTPVRDGRFQFVVTSLSCDHDSVGVGFVSKQAQGQYCIVDLSVRNVGSQGQLLLDGVQKAFSADGAEYTPDSAAGLIANAGTSVWVHLVDPGDSVSGKFVYDVPDGVRITKLELHDSAFSRGATVTVA